MTVWIIDEVLLVERHDRIESSWCDFAASQVKWRDRAFEKLGGFLQREIWVWSVKGAMRDQRIFEKEEEKCNSFKSQLLVRFFNGFLKQQHIEKATELLRLS